MVTGLKALNPLKAVRRAGGAFALIVVLLATLAGVAIPDLAQAQTSQSNVRMTKHNLSKNAPAANAVKSTNVDQVCVFCHTPHAATKDAAGVAAGPLWNRKLSSQTYTTYASKSMDALPSGAIGLDQPGGSSKLCLSCHDGSLALGQVGVLNGTANPAIGMTGTGTGGVIPSGAGADTGFTRRLGANLSNDHPISFTYNDALALKDGELRSPTTSGGNPKLIDSRAIGYRPTLPLENGQMQCTTCHDPHLYDPADTNRKFLRLNRTQKNAGPTTTFNVSNDIICLACHTKEGYADSAHAVPSVANEQFTATAATDRGLPSGTQVWQASCLACHDTHTVQGARRLLREGTDGVDDGAGHRNGGKSAIEETCYQCHSKTGVLNKTVLLSQGTANFEVPDIKTDFDSTRRMPINTGAAEVHDIGDSLLAQAGKDFIEKPELLGLGNRHVECTDCHNPHRVRKAKTFSETGTAAAGTHNHATGVKHTNTISGVLRGSWGVEPRYANETTNPFGTAIPQANYDVKRGDPGVSIATDKYQTYVTREYQICLKCHSSYAYGSNPPNVGSAVGSTPDYGFTDTGGARIHIYTDQAMEFQGPTGDQGVKARGTNHRSWHPVMEPTKRPAGTTRGSTRYANASNWKEPFDNDVGNQTIYCSDCHGSAVTTNGTSVPDGNSDSQEHGSAWGPHGSSNNFILKGGWNKDTGESTPNALCFKCHDFNAYASSGGLQTPTGFWNTGSDKGKDNLHAYHADKLSNFRCSYCHVAIPHGWKNKAFLVNLNDVGPEVGLPAGTEVRKGTTARYYRAPYYMGAVLKIINFAQSGDWRETDCGSKSLSSNATGRNWMRDSTENCVNPP